MEWFERMGGPQWLILAGALLSATGAFWAAQQQVRSERALREKSDEIAHLTQENLAHITGGDSFCYIEPRPTRQGEVLGFHLRHVGKYALFNVEATLYLKSTGEAFVFGTFPEVAPNRTIQILSTRMPAGDDLTYEGVFMSRHKMWQQSFRLRKIGERWEWKVRVEKDEPWEAKSNGYPDE